MEYIKEYEYPIGSEGNKVSIKESLQDWHLFTVIDHYGENEVGLYLHEHELKGLADFINNYLENI